jgi:hypothetical protein
VSQRNYEERVTESMYSVMITKVKKRHDFETEFSNSHQISVVVCFVTFEMKSIASIE